MTVLSCLVRSFGMPARGRWRRRLFVPAAGLVLAVAGCGTPTRTITGDDAIQRLDAYLADALTAAPPGVHPPRVRADATYGGGCTKGLSDSGFTGQVEAEVEYQADGLPDDVRAAYLDTLDRMWTKRWGKMDHRRDGVDGWIDGGRFRLYGLRHRLTIFAANTERDAFGS
jgi:hypothetical protein